MSFLRMRIGTHSFVHRSRTQWNAIRVPEPWRDAGTLRPMAS
jgi:hypothetical protein